MTEVTIQFRHHVESPDEYFYPLGVFDSEIGQPVPLHNGPTGGVETGILRAAEIADDGASVLLTVTCDVEVASRMGVDAARGRYRRVTELVINP